MKIKSIILGVIAAAMALVSCNKEEDLLGAATLKVEKPSVEIPQEGGSVSFTIKATRDWTATISPEDCGFELSQTSGKASVDPRAITVTAPANTERRISATITFKVSETLTAKVKVTQQGAKGDMYSVAEIRDFEIGDVFPEAKIRVILLSDYSLGNIAQKNLYVQDETGGIQIRLSGAHEFAKGDQLLIDLEGAELSQYGQLLQIEVENEKVTKESSGNTFTALEATVEDFLKNEYEGRYISLPAVQVVEAHLDMNYVMDNKSTEVRLENEKGIFYIYTYNYAGAEAPSVFTTTKVPQGSGTIKGIASRYNNKFQLVLTSLDDVAGMTEERFEPTATVTVSKDIIYPNQDAGSVKLTLIANCAWTAVTRTVAVEDDETSEPQEAEWITLSKNSGDGNDEITVEYDAYDGESERRAEVVFTTPTGVEAILTVVQKVNEEKTIEELLAITTGDNSVYYRTTGKIVGWYTTSSVNLERAKQIGQFYIADADGNKILVYGCRASMDSDGEDFDTLGLEVGDDVTLDGPISIYKNTPQFAGAYVTDYTKVTDVVTSVSGALAAADYSKLNLTGTVLAKNDGGRIISDGTANMYVYMDKVEGAEVGDNVSVKGIRDTYYGLPRLICPDITTNSTGGAVNHTTLYDLSAADDFASHYDSWSAITYVKIAGTAEWSADDERLYVTVGEKKAGIYYGLEDYSAFDGKDVTLYGYSVGVNDNSKGYEEYAYMQVMLVSIEASPFVMASDLTVSAGTISVSIPVSANVAWTVTKDDASDWVTSFTESGENNGAVTVDFSENMSTSARVAIFTISAQGAQSATVVLTQSPRPAADSWILVENIAELTSGTYVIAFTYDGMDGYYAMNNGKISSKPGVTQIAVSDGAISGAVADVNKFVFTGSNTDGFTIMAGSNYLDSTDSTTGVKIGTISGESPTWCVTDTEQRGFVLGRKNTNISRYVALYKGSSGAMDIRYYNYTTASSYKCNMKLFKFIQGAGQ